VEVPGSAVGERISWTTAGDFNPAMGVTRFETRFEVVWRCVAGHEPWQDGTFDFGVSPPDDGRPRLRFRQDYAVELADDPYGASNFNRGYDLEYLESLRPLLVTGAGKPLPAG
jgi:hypothetical protein